MAWVMRHEWWNSRIANAKERPGFLVVIFPRRAKELLPEPRQMSRPPSRGKSLRSRRQAAPMEGCPGAGWGFQSFGGVFRSEGRHRPLLAKPRSCYLLRAFLDCLVSGVPSCRDSQSEWAPE